MQNRCCSSSAGTRVALEGGWAGGREGSSEWGVGMPVGVLAQEGDGAGDDFLRFGIAKGPVAKLNLGTDIIKNNNTCIYLSPFVVIGLLLLH